MVDSTMLMGLQSVQAVEVLRLNHFGKARFSAAALRFAKHCVLVEETAASFNAYGYSKDAALCRSVVNTQPTAVALLV